MQSTSSYRSNPSAASSISHNSIPRPSRDGPSPPARPDTNPDVGSGSAIASIPLETLVEYLLAAKRSLSSIDSVLRANEIATSARLAHEEAVVLSAETEFLRHGVSDQALILMRIKKNLLRTYKAAKADFRQLIRMMDSAESSLRGTLFRLRSTTVQKAFRPPEEEPKNLLDFVDETSVHEMIEALKASIKEFQAIQTSFDGDILRLQTDIGELKKTFTSAPELDSPSSSQQTIPQLLGSLAEHSHVMAELLTSLTKHFDLCVTAVRITEGGAALARRKAAETLSSSGDNVSISGVIAEQESQVSDLEPVTTQDRADMVRVVIDDASEVEDVVGEINERLTAMEAGFASIEHQTGQIRAAHAATLSAFQILEDVSSKLGIYVAAEAEFIARWDNEKAGILSKLEEMEELRAFYEGYLSAYDRLLLEVERRRAVEDKIRSTWKKAQDVVGRFQEADQRERESFLQDVGEFLPTDLWHGMKRSVTNWEVRPVINAETGQAPREDDTPILPQDAVEAAKQRLRKQA